MNGLCECGCGKKTTVSNRTRVSKGHIKGQPMRFILGHVNQGKSETLIKRLNKSRALTGREPIMSPYVPDTIVTFIKDKGRWSASTRTKKGLHARIVWEHFKGAVPAGYRVHHKDGRISNLRDDRIDNLMLLTNEWNLEFMPCFAKYFGIPEREVTDAYLIAERLPYQERFNAVRRILLRSLVRTI
jgi:hypothetical protein